MKRYFFTLLTLVAVVLTASATDLTGKRIYVNPGHGSYGPNDRPMATIPYPNLASTGMPDTCGFYESNTDMWKCQYLRDRLVAAGATVVMSREESGPWPYEKVNGEYPSYSWADYSTRADYSMYNRSLSEICEEVEVGNFDLFLSVHSNAATDGTATNYPLFLYRGEDTGTSAFEQTSRAIGSALWPWRWEMFEAGYDYASFYSATNMNVRGDINFYGSSSVRTDPNTHQSYRGYLGVLKHGVPGGLFEGYFHTYQPARHRALNHDHCYMEGIGYFRGIMDYFGCDPDTLGYICGSIRDMDAKMTHNLYKYAARTNDQWVPCNGATVYLLGALGDTLKTYHVDSLYNGTFVFYDLQPGVYHLAAECDGYYSLDEEQRVADVVVTANHTTYPFLQLRDTSWTPPTVVYETYPDKSSGVTGLDGQYNFSAPQSVDFSAVVAGKIVRQVLVRNDQETYILALDTANVPYLYRINTLTGALLETISTDGLAGETYPLYNIGFTADSVLVGGSYAENQYSDSQVRTGTVRGTFRTYYWAMDSTTNALKPLPWFTSQLSGNFYNAMVGQSFAVSGTLLSATVYTNAANINNTQLRTMQFNVDSMNITASCRNQDANNFSSAVYGDYEQIVSPVADDRTVLLGDIKGVEYGWSSDAQPPLYGLTLPATKGGQAFRYGGQAVIAAPVVTNGVVTTINLYNVSAGRSALGVVTTNISENITASYYSVKPLALGKTIVLYLATEDHIYRFTTSGVAQPSFRNIYAYDLVAQRTDDAYDLTFSFNTLPIDARVYIYTMSDSLVKTIAVENPTLKGNTIHLPMPIEGLDQDVQYKWAVEAVAHEVGNWAVAEQKTAASMGMTRVFNTVNVYPETDHFGTIYLMDRAGAAVAGNGMYVMNPDLTLQNTTPYKGSQSYSSPYRFGIASDGHVFVGDWGDGHSGIYSVDPDTPDEHLNFFAGTQNSSGLWKNAAGVEEGSSTPSVFVYGTGADTKLLVYNEDPGTTLPTNGLCVYNIGQPDGSILHFWDGAPSAKMDFAGQLNTNGNVWGCSKGVWVSQHRNAGNNNASATSLRFYSWDGTCTYGSHLAPTTSDGVLIIDGSLGSCFALTPDESTIILRGTDYNLLIFDVAWDDATPTLSLREEMKLNTNVDYDLLQLNWDYAGNLIASGGAGVYVIAVPKEDNRSITPSNANNTIINGELPFDHCLYDPAAASISTWFTNATWQDDTLSTAVLDSEGDITVNIAVAKSERLQAQVKLATGIHTQQGKLYSLYFEMESSVNLSGVSVRMFDQAVMYTDSTINLVAEEPHTHDISNIEGVDSEGVLVFDFGPAPAGAQIRITNIAICELGDVVYDQLFEIGDNQQWNLEAPVVMNATATNVFEGTFTFSLPTSYFAFITEMSSDWEVVNAHRFGAAINNELITDGAVINLAKQVSVRGEGQCLTATPGTYTITVDLNALTATVRKEDAAIDRIGDDVQAEKFYRDGHIYIRKNGHVYNTAGVMVE